MCSSPTFAWLIVNANLLSGFLGIFGSILLAIPTFLGASLREESIQIDQIGAKITEPELIQPLMINALNKSLTFLRREQRWMRAGTLCLLAAFVLMSVNTMCNG